MGLMRLEKEVRALAQAHSFDVISAQDPFEYGRIAARACKESGAKLHVQVHTDFLSPWFTKEGGFRSPKVRMPGVNRVRQALADEVLPQAAGIRVVSERIRASLLKRYEGRVVDPFVLPVPVSAVFPEAVPLPVHSFSFSLATAGRLEPEKRIQDILYALGRVRHQYSVGLFILGDGSERKSLEALSKKLGLTDRVVFLGWQDNLLGVMRSASCYIQASAYEGYGRTLIEAALARLPIITTDVGIVGEVFQGYKDVLSAPVGDPAALAAHIVGLIQDHQARELLAREAEHTVRNHLAGVGDVPGRFAEQLRSLVYSTV